ncbi:sugar transferase [Roseibium hamelinense]|nr:sugar transferase [Roseibium hamelinense]
MRVHSPGGSLGNSQKIQRRDAPTSANDDVRSLHQSKATPLSKRMVDIFGAGMGLVLLAPLLLLIAGAIKATSRGRVLFRQKRLGQDGKPFVIMKFRTMRLDACDPTGVRQTLQDDERVTPVGRFLRRSNFDELPQLINVLRGDMSLVGPRPHVDGILAAGVPYENFDRRYHQRLAVKPGITGWAQVNGWRGETRDPTSASMRLHCDLYYIENQSLTFDLEILGRTVVQEFLSCSGS